MILYIIIGYLFVISSNFAINKILENIRLKKISKYKDNIIIDSQEINQLINNIDEEAIHEKSKIKDSVSQKIKKVKLVKPYINKLKDATSQDNLKILNHNLKNLKISRKFLLLTGTFGYYYSLKKEIAYSSKKVIGHEVMHAASSILVREVSLSGFAQRDAKTSIGIGLTEGYTELLAFRLFGKKIDFYKYLVRINKMIELFFDDKTEMENYYFNCDLPALIRKLEGFADRKQVIDLITKLDIFALAPDLEIFLSKRKVDICLTLYEWFLNANPSIEKIKKMESIMSEDKLLKYILTLKKAKLNKNNPYDNRIINENKHKVLNKKK